MSPMVKGRLTGPTAPAGFEIRVEFAQQLPVLVVEGDLDLATAPLLKRQLSQLLAGGCELVLLDMAGVSFIDSTAIGVLVAAARRFPHDQLVLVGALPSVSAAFALCGLEDRFPHYPSRDQALAARSPRRSGGE